MTINISYDKKFAFKSLVVLVLGLTFYGVYKYAYKKGIRDMARYVVALQEEEANRPKIGDDETGHGSTR